MYGPPSVRLGAFAAALRANPRLTGFIVVYGQRNDDVGDAEADCWGVYDSPEVADALANAERDWVVNVAGVAGAQVVTVNGGHRQGRQYELWLSPAAS